MRNAASCFGCTIALGTVMVWASACQERPGTKENRSPKDVQTQEKEQQHDNASAKASSKNEAKPTPDQIKADSQTKGTKP